MLFVVAISCSGCFYFFSTHKGEAASLDTTVFFRTNGLPASSRPVYVLEKIGTTRPITIASLTNEQGAIHLSGGYCLPVIVAVDGGGVVIHSVDIRDTYIVEVSPDGLPDLEKIYGVPEDGLSARPQSRNSC